MAVRAADVLGRADPPNTGSPTPTSGAAGSRLVRWAAVESVQILPKTTAVGQIRDRVAARRGRNIGVVVAARRQLEYVFYAAGDHHVRAVDTSRAAA